MMLRLSERQIREKLKLFRALGPPSLIHQLRGKPSNHRLETRYLETALGLVVEKYPDFGPTFAAEKLFEIHGLKVNHETLRLMMIEAGLWKPKKQKVRHRQWRDRKDCLGELVQLDGSDHAWFEGRAPRCDLLAFIDDATSQILQLEFAPESTLGVMRATKNYLDKHGRPVSFYTDRGGVYKINQNNPDHDKLTQYERALNELDIKPIHARSPQAKGRVERLFGTLQDRLVKELRLRAISTTEEANQFIKEEYLTSHNLKYAVIPKSSTNLHRSIENYDIINVLCLKEERTLTNDFTVRYESQWFQLEKKQNTLIIPKDVITVSTLLTGETNLSIRKTSLSFHEIDKPIVRVKTERLITDRKPSMPSFNHPWRQYQNISKLKPAVSILQKAEVSILR
jgi:transposase InsO family protein